MTIHSLIICYYNYHVISNCAESIINKFKFITVTHNQSFRNILLFRNCYVTVFFNANFIPRNIKLLNYFLFLYEQFEQPFYLSKKHHIVKFFFCFFNKKFEQPLIKLSLHIWFPHAFTAFGCNFL
jgi:hypothetical protein